MTPSGGTPAAVRDSSRWRALRASAATLLLTLVAAAPAAACEVCFGSRANGSPLVTSARLGVFLLLGITFALLASIAGFFFYLRQRARRTESEGIASEWTQLQRSSLP